LLPRRGGARIYNSALMELGQRICTVKAPACGDCPVSASCLGKDGEPGLLPTKLPRRKTVRVDEHVLWTLRENGDGGREVLLVREEAGRRRKGLWRLPERAMEELDSLPRLLEMVYAITNHRVTLRVYEAGEAVAGELREGEAWVGIEAMETVAMAAPYRKAAGSILSEVAVGK
jgi:A/G-specific adenine glycosylase